MHEAGPERCAASHSHITAQLRTPLHIHSLGIQNLNACPASLVVPLPPPTPVRGAWPPGSPASGTHKSLFTCTCTNLIHTPVWTS